MQKLTQKQISKKHKTLLNQQSKLHNEMDKCLNPFLKRRAKLREQLESLVQECQHPHGTWQVEGYDSTFKCYDCGYEKSGH